MAIMKRQVMAATTVDTIRIIMMDILATDIVMPELVMIEIVVIGTMVGEIMGNMKGETMMMDIENNVVENYH